MNYERQAASSMFTCIGLCVVELFAEIGCWVWWIWAPNSDAAYIGKVSATILAALVATALAAIVSGCIAELESP